MNALKTYALMLCLGLVLNLLAQNPQVEYYKFINKGEVEFVNTQSAKSLQFYDSAFSLPVRIYPKDAYVAAQLAFYLQDTSSFYKYMKLAFERGLPLSAVTSAPILRNLEQSNLFARLEKMSKQYVLQVDTIARDSIYWYCFYSDGLKYNMGRDPKKIHVFDSIEWKFIEFQYRNFLSKGLFPNENLIGIATDSLTHQMMKDPSIPRFITAGFAQNTNHTPVEYELVAKYSLSVWLHKSCGFQLYKNELWQAVLNGTLSPMEYAIIEETSMQWRTSAVLADGGMCSLPTYAPCYNLIKPSPIKPVNIFVDPSDTDRMAIVNTNRAKIFLQPYEVDQLKKQMLKDLGIDFFYDFFNR